MNSHASARTLSGVASVTVGGEMRPSLKPNALSTEPATPGMRNVRMASGAP
jgi:hypothetical protein